MRPPPTPRRGYLILWWIFDLLGVSVTVLGLVGGAPAQGWGRIEPISFLLVSYKPLALSLGSSSLYRAITQRYGSL